MIEDQNCTPHIPPKSNRYDGITYSKAKYKKRNLSERCFNKLKQFRHIATRYDRSARSTTSLCSKLLASDYGFGFMSPRLNASLRSVPSFCAPAGFMRTLMTRANASGGAVGPDWGSASDCSSFSATQYRRVEPSCTKSRSQSAKNCVR